MDKHYGVGSRPPPPQIHMLQSSLPAPQNVILCGNGVVADIDEVTLVGWAPNPIRLVSSSKYGHRSSRRENATQRWRQAQCDASTSQGTPVIAQLPEARQEA